MNGRDSLKEKLGHLRIAIKNKTENMRKNLREYIEKKDFKLVEKYRGLNDEKKMRLALSLLALVLTIGFVNHKTRAYEIYMNDKLVGVLRNEREVQGILGEIKDELCTVYDMEVVLHEDLDLRKVYALNSSISPREDLKESIKNRVSLLVEAYELKVDSKAIGALDKEAELKGLVEEIKNSYKEDLDPKAKIEKVELLEKLEINKKEIPIFALDTREQLREKLLHGGEAVTIHRVEAGDSLWTIAAKYNTTMEDLIEANPDRDPDKLQIDDEVKLVKTKPLLTVAITTEAEYGRDIDYEEILDYDENMYANKKEVKVEGRPGRAQVVAKEVWHNGKLVEEDIVREEIIEEPVNKLIVQGTKELPKTIGTGVFSMPTRGRISSRYGRRNGRMHKGIDIATKTGTPINAADGGTVVKAGYSGAYGYLVEIDHKNGYTTRYAHCSKIHVSVGDKVHKGQHIANVGSTGRSTGPHLHLEVLKNGVHQNPSNYVN